MPINEIKIKIIYNEMLNNYNNVVCISDSIYCFKCPICKHITKTITIDKGIIPFTFDCENCGDSAFKCKEITNKIATFEWFRPTLEETKKYTPSMIKFILSGGLDYREIKKDNYQSIHPSIRFVLSGGLGY